MHDVAPKAASKVPVSCEVKCMSSMVKPRWWNMKDMLRIAS